MSDTIEIVKTTKRKGGRPPGPAQITSKNFEKKISEVYYNSAIPMLEECLAELRAIVKNPLTSDLAKIRACELAFTACRIIKSKDPVVQVNTQINNRNGGGESSSGNSGSFESILRRLEARDQNTSQIIDVETV